MHRAILTVTLIFAWCACVQLKSCCYSVWLFNCCCHEDNSLLMSSRSPTVKCSPKYISNRSRNSLREFDIVSIHWSPDYELKTHNNSQNAHTYTQMCKHAHTHTHTQAHARTHVCTTHTQTNRSFTAAQYFNFDVLLYCYWLSYYWH